MSQRDQRIMELWSDGVDPTEIAKDVGIVRDAVIARIIGIRCAIKTDGEGASMGDVTNSRPEWQHTARISEDDFRKIYSIGMIVKVEGKAEMTSADEASYNLIVTNARGDSMTLPRRWNSVMTFVGLAHSPGLFDWNWQGTVALKNMREIDAWEKKNAADRAEYERLKRIFG